MNHTDTDDTYPSRGEGTVEILKQGVVVLTGPSPAPGRSIRKHLRYEARGYLYLESFR